ncbi:glycosyltransferase family 2 protein [Microvirga sp. CF3016]|uniref:glycosyltransferase family 2 protein n=1 Tax=Microvirga sp. CF3016 TaxID=3110181 RepID=UPI002E798A29|nr:glycosyltransferase family 2 protein [Microvirga sp. CF3016]MEE1610182.1 glycosyltransferase family 2 protein [Microvirga sp. CF3016]
MRILAVAVTYNPELALLAQVLGSALPQVQDLVVVDNGSTNAKDIRQVVTQAGGQVIANERNIGIAAAQNQGVARARVDGFTHVLLLDQDTVLAPGMVADLTENLTALEQGQGRIAAIGPAYYELNSQRQTRAYRADGLRLSRLSLANETRPVASDFIIASGSLIPLSVLEAVGTFKEDLFIDLVDVEWCFRARTAGYRSYLSPTAAVEHRLGSGTVQIGPREVAVHVPVRNYYWVRNALWLARQPYTPLAWRIYFTSRSLAFLATYTTLVDKRMLRLQLMIRGIRDSLASRLGPLNG